MIYIEKDTRVLFLIAPHSFRATLYLCYIDVYVFADLGAELLPPGVIQSRPIVLL